MTELPTWLLIVLVESLVLLLLALVVMLVIAIRRGRRTRRAIDSLVKQIRKQSKLRLEETGSFLEEKYRFEGEELQKAVEQVDKAEKLFFQRVINLYLKRDCDKLHSLDAWVAELIDVYKSLSPVMPAPGEDAVDEATQQKLTELETRKQVLEEELKITKATMASMISEFGNMFGGGQETRLDRSEVVEKVVQDETIDTEKVAEILESDTGDAGEAGATPSTAPISASEEPVPTETEDEVLPEPDFEPPPAPEALSGSDDLAIEADDEIDELLDGIDLSDGEELEAPK